MSVYLCIQFFLKTIRSEDENQQTIRNYLSFLKIANFPEIELNRPDDISTASIVAGKSCLFQIDVEKLTAFLKSSNLAIFFKQDTTGNVEACAKLSLANAARNFTGDEMAKNRFRSNCTVPVFNSSLLRIAQCEISLKVFIANGGRPQSGSAFTAERQNDLNNIEQSAIVPSSVSQLKLKERSKSVEPRRVKLKEQKSEPNVRSAPAQISVTWDGPPGLQESHKNTDKHIHTEIELFDKKSKMQLRPRSSSSASMQKSEMKANSDVMLDLLNYSLLSSKELEGQNSRVAYPLLYELSNEIELMFMMRSASQQSEHLSKNVRKTKHSESIERTRKVYGTPSNYSFNVYAYRSAPLGYNLNRAYFKRMEFMQAKMSMVDQNYAFRNSKNRLRQAKLKSKSMEKVVVSRCDSAVQCEPESPKYQQRRSSYATQTDLDYTATIQETLMHLQRITGIEEQKQVAAKEYVVPQILVEKTMATVSPKAVAIGSLGRSTGRQKKTKRKDSTVPKEKKEISVPKKEKISENLLKLAESAEDEILNTSILLPIKRRSVISTFLGDSNQQEEYASDFTHSNTTSSSATVIESEDEQSETVQERMEPVVAKSVVQHNASKRVSFDRQMTSSDAETVSERSASQNKSSSPAVMVTEGDVSLSGRSNTSTIKTQSVVTTEEEVVPVKLKVKPVSRRQSLTKVKKDKSNSAHNKDQEKTILREDDVMSPVSMYLKKFRAELAAKKEAEKLKSEEATQLEPALPKTKPITKKNWKDRRLSTIDTDSISTPSDVDLYSSIDDALLD